MPIRYILGRAGSGKSEVCLSEIRERLRSGGGDHPLVLLVPEQSTFKAEHALVTSPGIGGFMRAQVLSFRRLAFRVMQETGGTARIHLAENGKKMLLHKLLHRMKDELKVYRHSVGQPGFIERLNEMMVEFKRYRVDASRLAEELKRAEADEYPDELSDKLKQADAGKYPDELSDKLSDLLRICSGYEKEIAGLYVDAEDDLALLAERFGQSSYAGVAEVWIDGFNGFTPLEFEALSAIIRHARKVNVALCIDRLYTVGDEPDELDLFHPTASTLIRLRRIAAEARVREEQPLLLNGEPLPRYKYSPMLAELERALSDHRQTRKPAAYLREEIRIVSAGHRRAEAEAAARRMLELVRDGGYRWRDIAVLVRNMEDYRDVLATTFGDFGIPFFFDQKRNVTHHPLLELIRASLETVKGGWRYDSVFRAVKTGMLVPEATLHERTEDNETADLRMDLDRLENYVLAFGIHGTRWTDGKPWTYMPQLSLEEEPSARSAKETEYLSRINAVRQRVAEPLRRFEAELGAARTVRQLAEAVYGFLDAINAGEQLERWSMDALNRGNTERAREHAGIWDSVIDVLDQLVEMTGDEAMPLDTFAELLDTGLDNIKLGLVPPALDQVLIGGMERTRAGSVKHAFILGANDGVLPSAMKEDGILNEKERDRLGMNGLLLAPGSVRRLLDERFMIYTAMVMPSESLWIGYPLADDEGKAMLPSEVIRRIQRVFPQLPAAYNPGDPPSDADNRAAEAFMAHPGTALTALTVQLKQAQKGLPVADAWWLAYNWFVAKPEWREKLRARVASLFHTNREERIDPATGRLLYGSPLTASVSRMETFASCRFAHFAAYGLRLKDRKMYRLEAPDVGQLFHAALSRIGLRLQQDGLEWSSLTEAQCLELASAAVDALTPRLQSEILLSSNRYRFIARKLKQIVGKAAAVLAEHGRRGAFRPIGLEIGFGRKEALPPLSFTLDDGTEMEIAGRIDRVDRADSPQGTLLRIIDYKSSQTRLNLAEVYYGLSLQMLTYLDVVVTHSREWIGSDAKPGGLLYFHVHQPLVRSSSPLSRDEAEDELFRRFKMKGLVLADEAAVRLMDASLESGHSALIPVAMKADGTFYNSASVMTEEQWTLLRKHGRSAIRAIGGGIASGRVDIEPYRMGGQTACSFCAYKSVCHFDPQLDGNAFASKIPYRQEEVWQLMASKGDGE